MRQPNTQTLITHQDSTPIFGFWIYLMTDCILFATLFATFTVLRDNTFGGPSGRELFNLPFVLTETLILLTSSFTCGLGLIAVYRRDKSKIIFFYALTLLLGLAFLTLEISEFSRLVGDGNSWQRSAFLSSFFTLVGTHGAHITAGLVWMLVLLTKTFRNPPSAISLKRFTMLSLFWHFLDIVWIFIFTIVYLIGVI